MYANRLQIMSTFSKLKKNLPTTEWRGLKWLNKNNILKRIVYKKNMEWETFIFHFFREFLKKICCFRKIPKLYIIYKIKKNNMFHFRSYECFFQANFDFQVKQSL